MRLQIGILMVACLLAANASAQQKSEPPLGLSRAVEQIMRYQEQKTGVAYPGLPPEAYIADGQSMEWNDVADYNSDSGKIRLHGRYLKCDFDRLADNLEGVQQTPNEQCDLLEVRTILSHELGHYLTHLYLRYNVPDSWLAPHFAHESSPGPAIFGEYMVIEGIAEYFGCLFGPCSTPIAQSVWTRKYDIEEFRNRSERTFFFYQGGYDIVKNVMQTRGANDGLRWLLQNKLQIVLPDIAKGLAYRNQGSLNPDSDIPEQEEKLQIIKSVLPNLDAEEMRGVLKGCESVSILNLRRFNELARLRHIANPQDEAVNPAYLDEWFYLIEHDASLSGLTDMDERHLPPIVREFRQGRVPPELINLIGGMRWEYPRAITRQDPDYSRDTSWHRDRLYALLVSQKHTYRIGDQDRGALPDYSETPEEALKIQDETIAILAKRFARYAFSERGRHELSALIRMSTDGTEQGGVFIWDKNEIRLIPVTNTLADKKENEWNPPLIQGYTRVFGSAHTHPLEKDTDPQTLAGPSGLAKAYFGDASSDLNALRYYVRMGNPYMMWAVITALSKTEYNLDLYFRDLETSPNNSGRVRNTKNLSVLDIGNFTIIN